MNGFLVGARVTFCQKKLYKLSESDTSFFKALSVTPSLWKIFFVLQKIQVVAILIYYFS